MAAAASEEPADHALSIHVSEDSGMGADSMSSFIHQHLASILQPFAEQLEELRSMTDQIRRDLDNTTSRANANSQGLQELPPLIKSLRADLELSKHKAEAAKEGHDSKLEELGNRCVMLRSDVQKITDLEHRHHGTHSAILDLQQLTQATRLDVNRLISDMKDADGRLAEQYSTTLDKLQSEVSGLDRSHQAMAQTLVRLEKQEGKQRDDLDVFLEGHKRQRRRDEKTLKDTNASLASLNNKLDSLDARLTMQASYASAVKEDLATLERRHGQTMRMQTVQERQQQESNERQASFKQQLELARADLLNVMQTLGLVEGSANLVESVNMLTERSKDQGMSLQELQRTTQSHEEQLAAGVQRADELDACLQEQQEARRQVEERIAERVQFVERLIHGNEEQSRGEFERMAAEAAERAKLHEQYVQKFEQQAAYNQRTSEQLQTLEGDLETTGVRVHKLEDRTSSTEERVSKLGGSMDLTQEYWKGLTRGFQETHRRVAVDRDMLSPRTPRGTASLESEQVSQKGSQIATLPALAKTT
eukprot:TRINITY_DN29929_c0_g1_i1.p1 TRINITY_DN29929_c0_g1~~TRINITY_DN29929_c0_g1_i1.p1  ORF type:complete len:535 (+),score=120.97 TRINITY_DN29929_c0_g1_i1:57-1661(+)